MKKITEKPIKNIVVYCIAACLLGSFLSGLVCNLIPKAKPISDLKSCPFCASEAYIYYDESPYGVSGKVVCEGCDVTLYEHGSKERDEVTYNLTSKWNTRVGE